MLKINRIELILQKKTVAENVKKIDQLPEWNLNIGIVGAGSFAEFAAKAFLKVEGVRIRCRNRLLMKKSQRNSLLPSTQNRC
jgi:hypothetical protein